MSQIVKKISSPYLLVAANGESTEFTVGQQSTNNAQVTINGNLVVRGTQTTIDSVNTAISDNIITLNAGLAANVAPTLNAGIEVNRGNQLPAVLRWNEEFDRWELSSDGANFVTIATQLGTGFLSLVFDDKAPMLGGDLDVNGFVVYATDNVILAPGMYTQIDSAVQIKNVTTVPPAEISGYNIVYASTVAGGGTGLYVTNSVTVKDQELVSKRRAIVYSLIF
jgi:hypothetical protein